MSAPYPYPVFQVGGASYGQIGEAAGLRYASGMPSGIRQDLNAIVHSGDQVGPFATMPNKFRDPTFSYDPRAQGVIDAAKKYK